MTYQEKLIYNFLNGRQNNLIVVEKYNHYNKIEYVMRHSKEDYEDDYDNFTYKNIVNSIERVTNKIFKIDNEYYYITEDRYQAIKYFLEKTNLTLNIDKIINKIKGE